MATISVDDARYLVSKVYKGPTWTEKVCNMSDKQVIALYYSFLEKGKFDSKPKKSERKSEKKSGEFRGKRANISVVDEAMFDEDEGYQMYFEEAFK